MINRFACAGVVLSLVLGLSLFAFEQVHAQKKAKSEIKAHMMEDLKWEQVPEAPEGLMMSVV